MVDATAILDGLPRTPEMDKDLASQDKGGDSGGDSNESDVLPDGPTLFDSMGSFDLEEVLISDDDQLGRNRHRD
ncbi:hypothetical protein COT87_01185 [Candidatus Collierbacteria bacterium CG10_big_fil_rev_8_21_14_0_10_44_9]|uniref:Uncharacterized protein n=1 Tax=Candidatus Collierbacteria bacterium CG10_big_fil_rev_8_21_14_0_10_44_9 TaxID=1974535 RepID=A0A2H0VJ28_9BACT|nr:MAG: hypothetical protein COT87_01185 [Candidatus Collierbacteria bacterium CG10_big_fil_rev_8_21_14_0_10_44_9]